jgi:hypothetical protein
VGTSLGTSAYQVLKLTDLFAAALALTEPNYEVVINKGKILERLEASHTRARIRLTLAGSARRARSSKYSSVRIAGTFSASARVISWLRATPSDSAALRASANNVGGTRRAKLLRLLNSLLLLPLLGFLY